MVGLLGIAVCISMAAAPPGGPVLAGGAVKLTPTVEGVDLSEFFTAWSTQTPDLPGDSGMPFAVELELGGGRYTLVLDPFSVRAEGFQALVVRDGELVEVPVEAPKTYRGYVEGLPGSIAGGSYYDGQLRLVIEMGDLGSYGVQPVADFVPGVNASLHVAYAATDSFTDDSWTCGTDELRHSFGGMQHHLDQSEANGPNPAGGDRTAEVAFDTDFEFFQRRGSVQACIDDIEAIQAGVDVIYERDVNICHVISRIIVRDTSNDPYSGTDAETILTQFQNHWNSQQGGVQRDLAHLMAGRSRDGGILGIAYLSVVCNRSSAYGVSWTLFSSNMTQRVALTAHEEGHNWGAGHCCSGCSGCSTCRIMCPCLGGCSGNITSFGTSEINQITNHRNSRSCLTDGCGGGGGGGGGVQCGDVKNLKARCRDNGAIKGKVILFDETHDGEQVIISIDGRNFTLTIANGRAPFNVCCYTGPGHSVSLVDPGNCITIQVSCN